MAYLIAKCIDIGGCYALEMQHGKRLSEFSHELSERFSGKGIEIITISRPEAYGEYAPYIFTEEEKDFEEKIANLLEL